MATPTTHSVANIGGFKHTLVSLVKPNTASVHLTAFALLLGSHAFHGFIGGPVAFSAVPRQTFGLLQSKIFPVYFAMGTLIPAGLIANLAYAQGSFKKIPDLPLYTLAVPLVANAINWLYLGPKATTLMFERHAQEKQEGVDAHKDKDRISPKIKAMNKKFAQLHGASSLLNLLSFGGLLLHSSWIANYGFGL